MPSDLSRSIKMSAWDFSLKFPVCTFQLSFNLRTITFVSNFFLRVSAYFSAAFLVSWEETCTRYRPAGGLIGLSTTKASIYPLSLIATQKSLAEFLSLKLPSLAFQVPFS